MPLSNCGISRLSGIVIAVLLLQLAVPATAAVFSRMDLGYSRTADFDLSLERTGRTVNLHFGPGVRFSGTLGWTLPADLGIEFELAVLASKLENPGDVAKGETSGGMAQIPLFANLIWHPSFGSFSPFVGVGGGGLATCLTLNGPKPAGFPEGGVDEQAWAAVVAYHAFAGLSWSFSPRWGVHLAYDYQHAGGPTWDFNTNMNTKGSAASYASQSISFGIDLRR